MRLIRLLILVYLALLPVPGTVLAAEEALLHTIPYGQGEVAYLDAGSGGTPLVFVHGWSCDMTFWDGQLAELAAERRCIAIDLPGHGASSDPDVEYTQDYLAGAVLAVMDHAGVDSAVLVGHSMGASVIRIAALARPERVAGLAMVDGAIILPPEEPEARAALEEQVAMMRDMISGEDGEGFTREFIDSMHSVETPEAVKDWVMGKMLSTPEHVRVSSMVNFLRPDEWARPAVETPTLALFVLSPDLPPDTEEMMRAMFPNMTWILWDGPGHFVMQERPGDVAMVIRDFLGKLAL